MSKTLAVSERKLLRRLKIRLILFYMIAFLLFELLVLGMTYFVVKRAAMIPMYQSIHTEWQQQYASATTLLAAKNKGQNGSDVVVRNSPEQVATWIVAKSGRIVVKDFGTPSAKRADSLINEIAKKSEHSTSIIWMQASIDKTPVLLGAKPVSVNHTRLGTMVGIRSLHIVDVTVATLARVEFYMALGSILVLLPFTYFLSQRSLSPVRSALVRQRNFVNDAAHELRTPLTILHGTLELAQYEEKLSVVREAIQTGIAETDYITALISDLSTLARMESGATELNLKHAMMNHLVSDTVDGLRLMAHKKRLSIVVRENSLEVEATVDERRIRQLLTILIDNAVKYTPERGDIEVSIGQTRSEVVLSVKDTGIGISEQDLPHIFDRFFRATTVPVQTAGSGIGLAIGAWIVQAHGGRILVESQEHKGTTFNVMLPKEPHVWPLIQHKVLQ